MDPPQILLEVTGTIFRGPEQRTSKACKVFISATIGVKDGDESQPVQAEISIFERLTDVERDALIAALESSLEDEAGLAGGSSGTTH
jgi:hypothetical protein